MCHMYHSHTAPKDSLTDCSQGSVAQLVEQRASNPKVVGSNPTLATEFFNNSVGHHAVARWSMNDAYSLHHVLA